MRPRTCCISPGSRMIANLPGPLAVVCHDAGAANIILSWLAAEPRADVRPVMQGPAAALWRTRAFDRLPSWSLETALPGAQALLSGTGWASALEHEARQQAREQSIFSVAVIDHWTTYRERFSRDGREVLPDEIWVTDTDAWRIAAQEFPGSIIRLQPNRYLEEQVARVESIAPEACTLYLLEPALSGWGRSRAGEFQALDYFVANLPALNIDRSAPIRLRPHPSEAEGKYDAWIATHPDLRLSLDKSSDVAQAISRASTVAGCGTFAMVIALAAGRRVISTLPPWAPPCPLPQSGLIHLRSIAP